MIEKEIILDRLAKKAEISIAKRLNRYRLALADFLSNIDDGNDTISRSRHAFSQKETAQNPDDLDDFFEVWDEVLVAELVAKMKQAWRIGFEMTREEILSSLPESIGLSFDIPADEQTRYLAEMRRLHLSDYRGSISNTTNDGVRSIIRE